MSSLVIEDSSFEVLDDSSLSPVSFIALTLSDAKDTATLSNSTFKGMKTSAEGGFL